MWKKTCKALLFPPVWLLMVLTAVSAVALAAVFLRGMMDTIPAYGAYVLSFYTLVTDCIFCARVLPGRWRALRDTVRASKYGGLYFKDVTFKTRVTLYRALGVNLLYVGVNLFSGWLYRSAWFIILAAYYTILAVMRFLLLRSGIGKDRRRELRRARLCGIILMTVNLVLSGAVLMVLYQGRGYDYPGVLIYVAALYTFYGAIRAVVDLIKYRKYRSPVMSAAKVVSMASALVSVLALETAMLSQFGAEMSPADQRILIACTGAGISAAVVAMALTLMVRATRELKEKREYGR